MQYFIKNGKIHKFPVPSTCKVKYSGESKRSEPSKMHKKCEDCFKF